MQRKLIKVGTSAAVLIPKALMDEQGIKIGDTIHVEVSKKASVVNKSALDPAVLEWTKKIRSRYAPLLKKLADS
jgi:antitoxin component of MazEF toxin-antitoxin module